jgi:hypothetical protein
MHPFERGRLGPEMRQLSPERSAEKMSNEGLESLGPLRVPDSRIMLQKVWMIDKS